MKGVKERDKWGNVVKSNWFDLTEPLKEATKVLLNKLERTGEPQADIFLSGYEVYFVVVAKDWAGLLDAVSGVVHDKGYNINKIFATVLNPTPYALIVLSIANIKGDSEILKDRQDMIELLRTAAKGGIGLKSLISISGVKIRKYKEIIDEILKMAPTEEQRFFLGDDGEVIKFVKSRTEAYLEERDSKTLAEIVFWQNRFYREVKDNPSIVRVFFHNFTTKKGINMSGITVVGLDKYVSLDSVLSILGEEGLEKVYEKEFIYPEGISVVRVETLEVPQGKLAQIAKTIEETLKKPKTKRYVDIKFGLEIIGRVMVPRLIEEYINTGITQLLIFPEETDPERPIFRVIVAGEFENFVEDLAKEFSKRGFSFQSPKFNTKREKDKDIKILVFQTSTGILRFESQEEVYQEIKSILSQFIPKFRDFDEGLRKITVSKLNRLYDILEGVPRKIIRRVYYSLEDTFRVATDEKRLSKIISFAYSSVERFLEMEDKENLKVFRDDNEGICVLLAENESKITPFIIGNGGYEGYRVIGTVEIHGVFTAICVKG
ncbi:MAG: hypothetical protein ABIL16_05320 [candidate division WOR-3 bacterium]